MIKIERGKTIFESNAQTLVNTVNCVGVMGKGLALEFKNRYPKMFDKYKSFCDKGVFKPGVLWIYKGDDGKWVLNFPTKIDWKEPSKIEYIEEGLTKFVEIWKDKGITSIGFPLLGCGNGGLNPDIVIALMQEYLNQCEGLDVTIYDDREHEVESPKVDATSEFFGEGNPKEVINESAPLTDDNPPIENNKEAEQPSIIQENNEIKEEKVEENPNQISEEEEILKDLISERKAMNDAVDKILEDFSKGDNSTEYRKSVARKIVNVINRRGFPSDSFFQI